MRLHRALFYILLAIFIAGILLAVFVDPSKVMSRIATGLITGSFVGLLSSVVNYAYAWQKYISELFSHAFELFDDLEEELIKARMEVDRVESFSKESLIKSAKGNTPEDIEKREKEIYKYDKYRVVFDDTPYAPLFFSKKTVAALDDLNRFVSFDLRAISMFKAPKDMFVCLQDGHFSSKEEEEICIGDRDEFFDFIVQRIYDWRDHTAHCMRRLGTLLVAVQDSLKPFNIAEEHRMTPKIVSDLAARQLKDIPDRNPMDEMAKEMVEEMEERMKGDGALDFVLEDGEDEPQ